MELLEDNCSVCVCMGVWGGGGWGRCVPACMSEGQWKQISVQSELQCVADELMSALSTDLAVAVQIEKLQAVCCGWKPKSSAWCTSSIEPLTLNPRYLSQTMDQTFPCHIESDNNLFSSLESINWSSPWHRVQLCITRQQEPGEPSGAGGAANAAKLPGQELHHQTGQGRELRRAGRRHQDTAGSGSQCKWSVKGKLEWFVDCWQDVLRHH